MSPPSSAEPEVVLADLGLSRNLTLQLTIVGLLGLFVALAAFGALYQLGTGDAPTLGVTVGVDWWNEALTALTILVLATVIIVPHELLHGLAIRYYGGEPRYGFGVAHFVFPYAYATTDHRFTRNQFLVVLLTPLVVLTLVGVPAMLLFEWPWIIVPLAANAAGAVGDVWMTLTLLGYPGHVDVEDHRSGFRILGREGDRRPEVSVTAAVWDAVVGAATATVALLLALGLGGPFVLPSLGVESLTVGRPGTITFLFEFTNTPTEISLSVGPGVPVLGALVGLGYAFVRTYRRRRAAAPAAGT